MDIVRQLEVLVRETAAKAMLAAYDRRYGDKRELLATLSIVHTAHLRALAAQIDREQRDVRH